jgi:hypothetical protein
VTAEFFADAQLTAAVRRRIPLGRIVKASEAVTCTPQSS